MIQQAQTLRVLVFPVRVSLSPAQSLRTGNIKRDQVRPVVRRALRDRPKLGIKMGDVLGIKLAIRRVEAGEGVVNEAMTTCPRCGQNVVDRGYEYYCLYGCTRSFPKLGALASDRFDHERRSGLVMGQHALEGAREKLGVERSFWGKDRKKTQLEANRRWRDRRRARAMLA